MSYPNRANRDEIDLREILDRVWEFHTSGRRRRYASRHESLLGKPQKEYNVAKHLLDEIEGYTELTLVKPDPPDLTARDADKNLVAIEVTELVDQETVAANQRPGAESVYRLWEADEVVGRLSDRIAEKDRKDFHGGPYAKTVLVIFTDEYEISSVSYRDLLSTHDFGETRQIDEAYLLFYYDPATESYPRVRLPVRKRT